MAYKYTRKCLCGNIKQVGYKPRGDELCMTCSARKNAINVSIGNRKKPEDMKRYTYICSHCPSVRIASTKRKGTLCIDCSRKHSKKMKRYPVKIFYNMKENKMIKIETPKIRHFRICPTCPEDNNTRPVKQASLAGIKQCAKCLKPPKVTKPRKKSSNNVSKVAIERAKKINKDHKDTLKSEKKKVIPQVKSDKELMEEFLSRNKPSVIALDEPMPHYWSGNGLGTSL